MSDVLLSGTITAAFGLIASCFAGYMSYKMAQLKSSADKAEVKTADAAVRVEAVKTQLAETTSNILASNVSSANNISEKIGIVHDLVNSSMLEQKKLTMLALDRVAELTKSPKDIALADSAADIYNAHKDQQDKIDQEKAKKA